MNQKLLHLYLRCLQEGYLDESAITLKGYERGGLVAQVMDAEWVVYPRILGSEETTELPEFQAAVKLYKTPLMEALK